LARGGLTYQVHDVDAMASNIATVTIIVKNINDSPGAEGDTYSTNEDTALVVPGPGVLANDVDVDSPTLTALRVSGPDHGTLAFGVDGGFTYTPDANYNGPDRFVYRARDGAGGSSLATVSLTINPVEDVPIANKQVRTLSEDSYRTITLIGTDGDGSDLIFTIVTPPVHGVLIGTLPIVTYDPDPNYTGPDSFSFKVNDGGVDSNTATVSLTISSVNDAPVALAAAYETPIDTPLSGQLVATDVESDPLTYSISQLPTEGNVIVDPATGAFTYHPFVGKTGPDLFKFRANDGRLSSISAQVDIQIR
jgi:VCBS repeat-containing protein